MTTQTCPQSRGSSICRLGAGNLDSDTEFEFCLQAHLVAFAGRVCRAELAEPGGYMQVQFLSFQKFHILEPRRTHAKAVSSVLMQNVF